MKTLLFSVLGLSIISLGACQSASTADASRRFELMGTNGRYSADLPASNQSASAGQPYALTGAQASAVSIPDTGYQARH